MFKLKTQQTINNLEKNFIKKDLPNLKIGDNVKIGVKIIEGNKERVQFYEGTIIAKKNSSINTTITVRKVLQGVGLGSIYGAIFMVLVPEILKFGTDPIKNIPAFQHIFAPLREVVFGALIVFFLIFEPRGLSEIWRRVKNFFMLRPFAY